jgi:hypothetical protein
LRRRSFPSLSPGNFDFFDQFCAAGTALQFLIEDFYQLNNVHTESLSVPRGARMHLSNATLDVAPGPVMYQWFDSYGGARTLRLQSTNDLTLLSIVVSSATETSVMAISCVSAVSLYTWRFAGPAIIAQRQLVSPATMLWDVAVERDCSVVLIYKRNEQCISTRSCVLLPEALQHSPTTTASVLAAAILDTRFSFGASARITSRCAIIAKHIVASELLAPHVMVRGCACMHAVS